jgi:pimeloyl-ACP methyl ester carboxylesterase
MPDCMKFLRGLIFLGVVTYGLAAAAAYFGQGKMLYYPDARALSDCNLPAGVEIWNEGGEHGLLATADHDNLLLFFHGNAGSACNWRFLGVNHLAALGYDVLVLEYPGYGGDRRTTSKQEIEVGLKVLADWVAVQEYAQVSVMGYSLGTGAASIYARDNGAVQVVLFAPFDSIYNVALAQGLKFPRALLREDFDNIAALADVTAPITIIHGEDDDVIPAMHSENLRRELKAAGRDVRREVRAGVGHNGLFERPAFDDFLRYTLQP